MLHFPPRGTIKRVIVSAIAIALIACNKKTEPAEEPGAIDYTYRIVNTYPHDKEAFTQGLLYLDGFLYEGTGLPEHSQIRKVKLETGEVVQKRDIQGQYFGEGITVWHDRLLELTWQGEKGFLYDLATFAPKGEFPYAGEGWGLTSDDRRLIMSDGTSRLRFIDPNTLQEISRLAVVWEGGRISQLNELEWIKGEIWANIYKDDRIVRIDPASGKVTGFVDMRGILRSDERPDPEDVLNGIAYDAKGGRIFVTGKRWPKLFEIQVVKK